MTRGLGGKAPANVQSYLKGAHYPTRKSDLVSTARRNGAPDEIIDVLEKPPEDEFGATATAAASARMAERLRSAARNTPVEIAGDAVVTGIPPHPRTSDVLSPWVDAAGSP
jgi:Protein of unknown function (DUF2795)